jgi:acetate kinase
MDKRDYLKRHPFFETFEPAALEQIAEAAELRRCEAEQALIRYGTPVQELGVIVEGTCAVMVPDEGTGELHQVATLAARDMFGEMSLLTGEPATADVVATPGALVLLVPQAALPVALANSPASIQFLGRLVTERLRRRIVDEAEARAVKLARRDARRTRPYTLSPEAGVAPRILVLNLGSSSLKYDLLDAGAPGRRVRGQVERIGDEARHVWRYAGQEGQEAVAAADHEAALGAAIKRLTDPEVGPIPDLSSLSAVGHRVVHGGAKYAQPVLIDDEVIAALEDLCRLAPLHNPVALAGIRACRHLLPDLPQVAVFDTAFHHTLPDHAAAYAIPHALAEEHGLRRYGFHGTSHKYVAQRASAHLQRSFRDLRLVTCHLGNGASVCAIDHGRSVDTSMGLTPLEGLVMGTRSGDIDPGLVLHMCTALGKTPAEVDHLLNRESGLLGLSGLSKDVRELEAAVTEGNARAQLAISTFCYRVKKYIGAYVAVLGGVDALIFTGGIGQGSAWIRARVCQGLAGMGIGVDEALNHAEVTDRDAVRVISDAALPVRVLVVPTDEEAMIARETMATLGLSAVSEVHKRREDHPIPINTSAHHVHLSQEHVEALFGAGHTLTHRGDLLQPGQFACEEKVELVGPKGSVKRVRVLGPTRKATQVEISRTEEFKLGIDAPIRASGDLDGSPGLTLRGDAGEVKLEQGVICAMRHIHATPEDALRFALHDRDIVRIRVPGERSLIFGDVLVRVNPDYALEMHIDTDEANAAELNVGAMGFLDGIQSRRA